jgi:membrane protease YdiL (CAAX protease family)
MATTDPSPAISPHSGYWSLSRLPLPSLIFVLPLLIAYEAGVILLGPQAARNGADVWLRWLLDALGLGQYFLLPALTVLVLLGWHHTTRQPWRIPGWVYWGMLVESVLLAVCLRLILLLQGMMMDISGMPPAGPVQHLVQFLRTRIGFLGAGIYEELLFRLILLGLAVWLLRWSKLAHWAQILLAVVITSLLFSAAHYVGGREPILWFSFVFRFLAGVFFALLFLFRGFGIAVGAHAGYDILVGLV